MSDRRGKQRREPRITRVCVEIACNDPDNGLFDAKAPFIQIGEFELAAKNPHRPPRFVILPDDRFRLAGRVWPFTAYKYGIGNWCWDGFYMPIAEAAAFLNWLWCRGLFDVDAGPTAMFDWWRTGKEPMEKRLLCMLIEEAIK